MARRCGEGSETKRVARVCESYGLVTWSYVRSRSRIFLLGVCVLTRSNRMRVYLPRERARARARHWWRRGRKRKREREKESSELARRGQGGWYAGNVFLGSHGARDASLSLPLRALSLGFSRRRVVHTCAWRKCTRMRVSARVRVYKHAVCPSTESSSVTEWGRGGGGGVATVADGPPETLRAVNLSGR